MNGDLLGTLGLSRSRVESTVDFLVAYANTCELERGEYRRPGDDTPGLITPQLSREQWNLHLEAASARCEAGQWAMLIDPVRALRLWSEAGRLYRDVRFGFGYYLSVITADYDLETSNNFLVLPFVIAMLARLTRPAVDQPSQLKQTPPIPDEFLQPQQQAYWLLAAATFVAQHDDEILVARIRLMIRSPTRIVWSRAACAVGPSAVRVSCRRLFRASAISQVSQTSSASLSAAR